jgi:hypothetical protein
MPLRDEQIWLPNGSSLNITEKQAAQAVEEYDPDLTLGYRRDTGDWCAFLPGNKASEGQPFPVFNFGSELPDPDVIKRQLYEHDVRRNGNELLDKLDRIYDEEQKRLADKAEEGREAVAEAIDSNMRMNGAHPFPRIFVGSSKYGGGRERSSG